MRNQSIKILGLLGLIVLSNAGQAAVLTFDESVRLAAQNNPDLRSADASVAAAEHRWRAARSGFLPQLSGSVSASDSSSDTTTTTTTTNATTTTTTTGANYSAGVTATQNLFAGFQDQAKVEQGAANLESARALLSGAKARLSSDLKNAYASLLYAQNNVALTQDILRRLEENLRLVDLRFQSGRENKGSFLLTRASVAQARFEHNQARNALVSAQAQLARVLGQPVAALDVVSNVPTVEPAFTPDFDDLMRQTPDVRDALAREQAAQAGVRLAQAGFYPSVNLSGSVLRDGDRWFPDDNRRVISATISIPFFTGGRDYYGVRGAAADLDVSKANRDSIERQLLVRLRQNYAAYVESVEKLQVDREFLEAAETRANIARARYQNGLISFEDWDRIENDLIQRQKALLVSQRGRIEAEAAWELVQGRGVIP